MGRPHLCVAYAARTVRDLPGPRRPEAGRCQQSRCESNFGNHLEHSRTVRPAQGESVSAKWCEGLGLCGPSTIRVKQPETEHTVSFGKLQSWLDGGGKSLREESCLAWRRALRLRRFLRSSAGRLVRGQCNKSSCSSRDGPIRGWQDLA